METEEIRIVIRQSSTIKSSGLHDFTHQKALPYFSLIQIIKGDCRVTLNNGVSHTVSNGAMFLAPPQAWQALVYHMDPNTDTLYARRLFFDWEVHGVSAELLYDFPVALSSELSLTLSRLLDSLLAAKNPYDRTSLGYQLGKELLSGAAKKAVPFPGELLPLLAYLKQHFAEPVTVATLAALAGRSESHLYVLFRDQFGCSPMAYVNAYRLSVAAHRLCSSSASVEAIAASVGIEDTRYFAKLFRRRYAATPTAYRKIMAP